MNTRYLKLSIAMGLALGSSQVLAIGLGQLQVKSGLNQPLVAEIPIISAMPAELDNLSVRLASPEAFERVGLIRPSYLTANLSFAVGKNTRGQNVILITSSGKFVEPFLSFLIEADWGRGSVTKEYTALIDPPYIAKAIVHPMEAPVVVVTPTRIIPPPVAPVIAMPVPPAATKTQVAPPAPVQQVAEVAPAPAPLIFEPAPPPPAPIAPEPIATEPEPIVAQQPEPAYVPKYSPPPPPAPQSAASGNSDTVRTVENGNTLWSIATEVRPNPSVTIKQMMVALLQANPDAFDGYNVNKLKSGSVLRIPSQDEATMLTSEQAATMVAEQSESMRSQRNPVPQPSEAVADNVAAPPETPVAKPESLPSNTVASAQTKPALTKKPKARLEIVPPSGKSSAAKAAQSGAAASAGGAELRAELTQAREDIAMRDGEISELKSRIADLESQGADSKKLIEMKDSQLKALQDELGKQQALAAAKPAPAVAPPPGKAIAAPVEPVPSAEPWFMNPILFYGAGGALLLGGLVWFLRRKKNTSEDSEPVVSRRISDDLDLQASLSTLQDAKKVHRDQTAVGRSVPQDSSTKEQPVPLKSAPVAPSEEPELVSLRNVVRSKPQDLDANLALLRFYYARGDSKSFEVAAQTMRTHVSSPQDPRWREAVVMGVAILPGHVLFNQAGWNAPKFEVSSPTTPVVASEMDSAESTSPMEEEPAFLSQHDLDELDTLEAVSITETNEASFAPIVEEAETIVPLAESDFVSISSSPDIHRSESELLALDSVSSTKIELARAYLEIGDVEGAILMLEEVVASGSAPAKAMAQRIIGELG